MPKQPSIRFENVSKAFGDLVVLDKVSFNIPKGETTAIIGPSGAGKSVILKHIVGLLQPDSGSVYVMDCDMGSSKQDDIYATRRRMGMLFQNGALFDSMTVGENIAFPLVQNHKHLSEDERDAKVDEVLKQVELPGLQK